MSLIAKHAAVEITVDVAAGVAVNATGVADVAIEVAVEVVVNVAVPSLIEFAAAICPLFVVAHGDKALHARVKDRISREISGTKVVRGQGRRGLH